MDSKYTTDILLDSLPFIKQFRHKTIVIKYGGSVQINPELKENFAKDISLLHLLGIRIIIVHGGGKDINIMLDKLQIQSEFINGIRYTTKEAMPIVEMVLSGNINKELSNFLNQHGTKAIGISGKDGKTFKAISQNNSFTGEITEVNTDLLKLLLDGEFIPVVAPIAYGDDNPLGYNINADYVACEIAKAMNALKIIFLTDTQGVLDDKKELIPSINKEDFIQLKQKNIITGGMIPKIQSCLECVSSGVEKAHIIDGRIKHSILLELFTSGGIGTEIY
ncbi:MULTISPECIES: acetylglutamate kinase [unclassified Helicobacter]|uniref:acetylglutamate kinase n=1 Tax=unclassified Helicobacter TaxID=2593540 RepID=UPI000CF10AA1|nr:MULTISPECIES: acetylglutamate kinase [unclassified Helicobacter]